MIGPAGLDNPHRPQGSWIGGVPRGEGDHHVRLALSELRQDTEFEFLEKNLQEVRRTALLQPHVGIKVWRHGLRRLLGSHRD